MGLKSGLKQSIEEIKDGQGKEEKKVEPIDKNQNQPNAKKENKENEEQGDKKKLEDFSGDQNADQKKKVNSTLVFNNGFKAGYRTFGTTSKDLVNVDTDFRYLFASYERGYFLDPAKHHQILLAGTYGRLLNKFTNKINPYIGLGADYRFILPNQGLSPGIGLDMDTVAFINLPEPGEGLRSANNRLIWLKARFDAELSIFNQVFVLGTYVGHCLFTKSDYRTVANGDGFSGKKYGARLQLNNVYKMFHLEMDFFRMDIESVGVRPVSVESGGYGVYGFYTF